MSTNPRILILLVIELTVLLVGLVLLAQAPSELHALGKLLSSLGVGALLLTAILSYHFIHKQNN